MIISASYRTDIPTFYGEWFLNRLKAGYCKTVNPFNKKLSRIELNHEAVDGFVFWTKNVGPFRKYLKEVQEREFPFLLQHTITGYPKVLERSVVDANKSVEYFREVAEEYGPRVCVWRYDTIIDSSITSREFHLHTFERLARMLEGATDEVVISFAQLYAKTKRNLDRAAKEEGFQWTDPSDDWRRALLVELLEIATAHKIQISICSQPHLLVPSVVESRCVDAQRLSDVAGSAVAAKLRGNRKECGCYESRDIGDYDTCPHGCEYCYAVRNQKLAISRFKLHDPESETLFPVDVASANSNKEDNQLDLFN